MGSMTIDELDRLVTDSVHSVLTFGNSLEFCGDNNHDVELNTEVVSGRRGGEERRGREDVKEEEKKKRKEGRRVWGAC